MGAPRASVKYLKVHRENLTVPAREQHSGTRDQVDTIESTAAMNAVCPARRNPCIIQLQVLVDCLNFFDKSCFTPEWLHYALHSCTSSNITHPCLRTKLSASLPLAFQSSPGETTTIHLPSASDLLSGKCSTKAGTAGFLPELPLPPPPPLCPCPQFTSVSLL